MGPALVGWLLGRALGRLKLKDTTGWCERAREDVQLLGFESVRTCKSASSTQQAALSPVWSRRAPEPALEPARV